jgi:hypothetical protein
MTRLMNKELEVMILTNKGLEVMGLMNKELEVMRLTNEELQVMRLGTQEVGSDEAYELRKSGTIGEHENDDKDPKC